LYGDVEGQIISAFVVRLIRHLTETLRTILLTHSERELVVTQKEGKKKVSRKIYVYNTDVVIALGFRVKGEWGKEFRVWARQVVRESYDPQEQVKHLIKEEQ
jgi:hypothetical protein